MVKWVIKRTGKRQKFRKEKIEDAILKAYAVNNDVDEEAKQFAESIALFIENQPVEKIGIEEIQDIIEKKLMASSHKDVAKVYINYRYLKEMARSQYNELINAVAEKLNAKNVQNQNANVDEHSFGGRVGEASSVLTKNYALNYLVSDMARENHENNMIYIHDLDAWAVGSHNCLSIPFDDLLANGFNTRQTDVRPAGSVNTAFQLVAVIFQLQSLQQFGGVAATHLDWTMVPYVRKSFFKHWKDGLLYLAKYDRATNFTFIDEPIESVSYKELTGIDKDTMDKVYQYAMDMTKKEIHQAVEGMYHNLNLLGRLNSNIKNIAA